MLRKFAVLVLVLAIGVIGGALGQSRLSASRHVAAPRRALGAPHATSPTPIPVTTAPVTPPPTLTDLSARELAFDAAPAQEVVLGKVTNDANENLLWTRLLDGVGAYAGSPAVMAESASRLEGTLNHLVPSDSVGYRVQDWRTNVGPLRFVKVGDSCGYGTHLPFTALLLVWPGPRGVSITQPMWGARSERANGGSPTSLLPPILALGMGNLRSVRAWKGQDGRWRLAAIARYPCGGSSFADIAAGAVLSASGTTWQADGSMIAPELQANGPSDAGLYLDRTEARFIDSAGTAIQLHSSIWLMDYESHGSEHAYVTRRYVRESDRYIAQPWQVDPSPYTTQLEVSVLAIRAQKGSSSCSEGTFPSALVRPGLGDAVCALPWATLGRPKDMNNDGQGAYKQIPTIYTYDSVGGTAQITVTPHRGQWTITAARWLPHH